MIRLHTTKAHHIHRRACLSWKHNVSDDFQGSFLLQATALIPQQSGGKTETEKERWKDKQKEGVL